MLLVNCFHCNNITTNVCGLKNKEHWYFSYKLHLHLLLIQIKFFDFKNFGTHKK